MKKYITLIITCIVVSLVFLALISFYKKSLDEYNLNHSTLYSKLLMIEENAVEDFRRDNPETTFIFVQKYDIYKLDYLFEDIHEKTFEKNFVLVRIDDIDDTLSTYESPKADAIAIINNFDTNKIQFVLENEEIELDTFLTH